MEFERCFGGREHDLDVPADGAPDHIRRLKGRRRIARVAALSVRVLLEVPSIPKICNTQLIVKCVGEVTSRRVPPLSSLIKGVSGGQVRGPTRHEQEQPLVASQVE